MQHSLTIKYAGDNCYYGDCACGWTSDNATPQPTDTISLHQDHVILESLATLLDDLTKLNARWKA